MQSKQTPYSGLVARNIPAEMAELARERGQGLTRGELLQAGFTEEQIDKHWAAAAALLRTAENRVAA